MLNPAESSNSLNTKSIIEVQSRFQQVDTRYN